MDISNEDRILIKKFVEVKNRGFYVDSGQLTTVYNRVLNKNERPTNCGSCIRQRIQALEDALKRVEDIEKKAQEALKSDEPNNTPPDENKEPTEAVNKPKGRPKKS